MPALVKPIALSALFSPPYLAARKSLSTYRWPRRPSGSRRFSRAEVTRLLGHCRNLREHTLLIPKYVTSPCLSEACAVFSPSWKPRTGLPSSATTPSATSAKPAIRLCKHHWKTAGPRHHRNDNSSPARQGARAHRHRMVCAARRVA